MYSDNETHVDLLGFEDQVNDICSIVLDPDLLPVTVGVLGDWGSGKSSLLLMAEERLRGEGAIVVYFSPWRIEDYDDAKSALLDAVVHEVEANLPEETLGEQVRESVIQKLKSLRRRVRWLRAAGMAAKHMVTVTAPSLDELDGLLRDEGLDDDADVPSTARLTQDFHEEFSAVVADLDTTVVVLVDDLDRCQPEQVLDVLHAMRLFLCVPGTAFVIATDERVVRDAVRLRYPQASEASETDLPQEYLEKIIQFPLRIPPLGHADVESYLNLLVAENHFGEHELETLRKKAAELRSSGLSRIAMNVGIARDVTTVPAAAEADFELVARIAGVLGPALKGNPRQLKRFLNGLELRRGLANRRGVMDELDEAVLAKLAVLEYAERRRFQELHEAQLSASGKPPALKALEAAVRGTGGTEVHDRDAKREGAAKRDRVSPKSESAEGLLANWTTSEWVHGWLAIDPPLAEVDLGPYFLLARDSVNDTSLQSRRLPPELQILLDGLTSSAPAQRDLAVAEALKLDEARLGQLMDVAVARMGSDSNAAVTIGVSLAGICEKHPVFVQPVVRAFAALPYTQIAIAVPTQLATRLREIAPAELRGLLDTWIGQGTSGGLSKAAQSARNLIDGNL